MDISGPSAYPALADVIDTYFDQDWDLISEDPDEVIAYYGRVSHAEDVLKTIVDIDSFLLRYGPDEESVESAWRRRFPGMPYVNYHYRSALEGLTVYRRILAEAVHTA